MGADILEIIHNITLIQITIFLAAPAAIYFGVSIFFRIFSRKPLHWQIRRKASATIGVKKIILYEKKISETLALMEVQAYGQTVFFGTNRAIDETSKTLNFTDKRTDELKTGLANISVPMRRKLGTIKRPLIISFAGYAILKQVEDPKKHFIILELLKLEQKEFCQLAIEKLIEAERFENSAFLFIHGFNVTFENALFRTAQLAHDLNFDGPAFLFSWPSVGSAANYVTDMDSAALAAPYLDQFMELILANTGVKKLHLIVHSMGNAALAKLMQLVGTKLSERHGKPIDQLILAAPDIDVGVFHQVARYFTHYSNGVTLYACKTDRALLLSKTIRNDYPRAGDVPMDGPAIFPDIDTIDVSAVGTSHFSLNHSLYAEDRGVLDDLGQLMLKGERPPCTRMPTLKAIRKGLGSYWVMPD